MNIGTRRFLLFSCLLIVNTAVPPFVTPPMLETERLFIRKFEPDDLEWLIEMRCDPDVNRYLGGPEMQTPDAVTRRMDFYMDCHETLGFGACAMIWKRNGERVGVSGLQPLEDTGEIEIGYSLTKPYWRMGLGYECAYAWLKYGFETAGLQRIVAVSVPENTGSWRIMEKCGMRYDGVQKHYGMDLVCYSIEKENFI